MCADAACLALRLEGPLQSWGTTSQFNQRGTGLLPSRSAVMGLICAALGLPRGSEKERDWLARCAGLHMKAVAVPRPVREAAPGRNRAADDRKLSNRRRELAVRRLEDYHTVLDTPKAGGGSKDCHITIRQYLLDAAFCVFLSGERPVLERAAAALQDPVWGLWLGRKCCIPSAPVFAGFFDTEDEALRQCLPRPLSELVWEEDAPSFHAGEDSVPDIPVSFASSSRQFSLRRITRHQGMRHAP
ncbi:MAG: type I-E CRISPR-associated protein Cas5/CasD [Desulfovibrionaceae bacterium]|nr:type I-E CRISPR-associated protein Cas5/CasD [Desulfovibrionaceae bacterium]